MTLLPGSLLLRIRAAQAWAKDDRAQALFASNPYVSILRPAVLRPCLCTSQSTAQHSLRQTCSRRCHSRPGQRGTYSGCKQQATKLQGALQHKLTRAGRRCLRWGRAVLSRAPNCRIETRKIVLVVYCTPPLYCTAMYWISLLS